MDKINWVSRQKIVKGIKQSGIKYHGTMEVVDFLSEIFPLKIPDTNSDESQHFKNPYEEFIFHTKILGDWDEKRIFGLKNNFECYEK